MHADTILYLNNFSPGSSDDAASCCVMLEVLRVLSKQNTRLQHSVLFLFNGAEENFLLAAHGFITQHEWAKNIRGTLEDYLLRQLINTNFP